MMETNEARRLQMKIYEQTLRIPHEQYNRVEGGKGDQFGAFL